VAWVLVKIPAHFSFPLSALRAGPLGPRSLLGGIPASRRSLDLETWPVGQV